MAGYIGAQPFTEASYRVEERVATAGQTLFNINYTPEFLDVLVNGVTLRKSDYTANNGSAVVFDAGLIVGDEVTFKVYGTFNVADTYTKAEVYTKSDIDAGTVVVSGLQSYTGNPNKIKQQQDVSFITSSQHNNCIIIMDGKVYSTSGTSDKYRNAGTGRGLNAQIPEYGLNNFKEIHFKDLPETAKIVKVGGNGRNDMSALFDNGWLYVWGQNSTGGCGLGHNSPVPVPTLTLTDVVDTYTDLIRNNYSVSETTLFVKRQDGYVWATGDNDDGHMGLGTLVNYYTFQQLTWLGPDPKFVGYNGAYGQAVIYQKADGTIWAAGDGEGGCMFTGVNHAGISTAIDITDNVGGYTAGDVVFSMNTHRHYTTAVTGSAHGILMRRDNTGTTQVWTAGYNEWGMRGDGTTTSSVTPYLVPNMTDVKELYSAGGNVATLLALKTNGDLWVWGHNGSGQCGIGDTNNQLSPVLALSGVEKVLSKNQSSHKYSYRTQQFVQKIDGSVWYCGYSDGVSYFGTGESASVLTWTKHPTLKNIKHYGAFTTTSHGRISVAIDIANNMYGWGFNGYYGLHTDNTSPVRYVTTYNLPRSNT